MPGAGALQDLMPSRAQGNAVAGDGAFRGFSWRLSGRCLPAEAASRQLCALNES